MIRGNYDAMKKGVGNLHPVGVGERVWGDPEHLCNFSEVVLLLQHSVAWLEDGLSPIAPHDRRGRDSQTNQEDNPSIHFSFSLSRGSSLAMHLADSPWVASFVSQSRSVSKRLIIFHSFLCFFQRGFVFVTRLLRIFYESKHVPLICSLAPVPTVYKRRCLVGERLTGEGGEVYFDVVTELVFADRRAFGAWIAELAKPWVGARIVEDEEKFLNRARTRACVIEERVTRE